jgi:hypothetical protein
MAFDFEALVGHLYIVGGRSISALPPGALVEVAPKKAARGRELDTFFVLVSPSGEANAPATFYEQMARLAAERYFNSSSSVTAGLRTVFASLNQDLTEHNITGKRNYEASILCAVLRDNELFLGRVGSGVCLFHHEGATQSFPADFSNDEVLFGPPLGVHPVPDMRMTRYNVAQGTRLVLADERLADLNMAKMTEALALPDLNDALTGFKLLVSTHLTMTIVEFVPPDAPSPVPARESRSTSKTPAVADEVESQPAAPVTPPSPSAPPVPQRNRLIEARQATGSGARAGLGGAALRLAGLFEGINHLLERILPQTADGQRSWLKSRTAAAAAVFIPVGIVVMVMVMWIGGTGESEFELCVQEANKTAIVARGIASSDVNGTLAAWNAVTNVVDRCNTIRAGDPNLNALTREAQNVVDHLFRVERREAKVLQPFPNALLKQVILQGLDVYVLDAQNYQVSRVTLAGDGRSIVPGTRQLLPGMRIGAVVQQFRINNIVDIAWSDDTSQIMGLDNNGVLVQCSPRFLQSCDAQKLLGAETWTTPIAMAVWQNRLYVLDVGANQIWRYEASGGTYPNTPNEYFTGQNRPDVRTAVDFGIDDKGNIYVLMADGQVLKFRSGAQVPFAFAGFPEDQKPTTADALFINNDPTAQGMYIVSRAARTIYETSLAGTFVNSYRAFNENDFATLANVAADANQQAIYALSGNTIFVLDRQSRK